jgi:hypothetical protein
MEKHVGDGRVVEAARVGKMVGEVCGYFANLCR